MGSTMVERLPLGDKKGSGERDDERLDGLDAVLCPWFCCSRGMVKWWSEGDEKAMCGGGRRKNQAKFYVASLFTPLKSKSS